MDTIDRIYELMKLQGINAAQLSRNAGISNGLLTQWKKGLQKPSSKNLQKIADYFNVTVDYLLSGEEQKNSSAEEAEDEIDINDINFALFGEVHDLTDGEREDVLNFVRFVKAQRKQDLKEDDGDGQT